MFQAETGPVQALNVGKVVFAMHPPPPGSTSQLMVTQLRDKLPTGNLTLIWPSLYKPKMQLFRYLCKQIKKLNNVDCIWKM
jgi:hypothetical protein